MHRTMAVIAAAFFLHAAMALAGEPEPGPERRLPSRVTFHKAPSEESVAERARRLKRECKGRPNAGACLGHASP